MRKYHLSFKIKLQVFFAVRKVKAPLIKINGAFTLIDMKYLITEYFF